MNKKYLALGIIPVLLLGLVVAAVVYNSIAVNVNVNEPLSVDEVDLVITDMYAGETYTETRTITNLANVDLNTELVFVETSNPDGVVYTITAPLTIVSARLTADVEITLEVATDSPTGVIEGTVEARRVA